MSEVPRQNADTQSFVQQIVFDDSIENRLSSWDFAKTIAPSLPFFLREIDRLDSIVGASFKVGTFTRIATTGAYSVTGVGFQPSFLMMFSYTTVLNTCASIGVSDGTTTRQMRINMSLSTITDSSNIVDIRDSSGGIVSASLTSFDADGFTINYSTNDKDSFSIYIAIK